MIKAVLFDMGDTLMQRPQATWDMHFRRMSDALHAALAACDPPGGALPDPAALDARLRLLLARHAPVYTRDTLLGHLLADLGWPLPPPHDALITAWHAPHRASAATEPDLPCMLDRLRGWGLQLGVLSNTGWRRPWRDQELAVTGILDYFPVRIYSADLEIEKPDPRIFTAALAALGGLAPAEVLYVGNDLRDDVFGAHGAGLWSAWLAPRGVTAPPPDAPAVPDLVLASLHDLPARLAARFPALPSPA